MNFSKFLLISALTSFVACSNVLANDCEKKKYLETYKKFLGNVVAQSTIFSDFSDPLEVPYTPRFFKKEDIFGCEFVEGRERGTKKITSKFWVIKYDGKEYMTRHSPAIDLKELEKYGKIVE